MTKKFSLSTGARDIIREAEKLVAAGRYTVALEQLASAQKLDPKNAYISAISERVTLLAQRNITPSSSSLDAGTGWDERTSRYLSVTVGNEFRDGIKETSRDDPGTPPEIDDRVRRLTNVAVNLFRRGSYDTAFDSLMKAYLLDPNSAHVIACERILLPTIELMRKRGTLSPAAAEPAADAAVPDAAPTQDERLGALKRKNETTRSEKERAMWRAASDPPRLQTPSDPTHPQENESSSSASALKHGGSGFFSKLKQGKFLG